MTTPDRNDEHGRTTGGVRGAINDLLGRGDDDRTDDPRTDGPTGARFDGQPTDDRSAADPRPPAQPPVDAPTGARFEGQHTDPQAADPGLRQPAGPPTRARFDGQPVEPQRGDDVPGGPDAGSRADGSSVVGAAAPGHQGAGDRLGDRDTGGVPGSARHTDVGPDGPGYAAPAQGRTEQHLTDTAAGTRTVDAGGRADADRNGGAATIPSGSGAGTVAQTSQGEDSSGRERLVSTDRAESYGSRWDAVKGEFVDEPRKAVADADALVGELLDELQTLFTEQRKGIERSLAADETSTEDMRLALRRYRSFFDRLLSI